MYMYMYAKWNRLEQCCVPSSLSIIWGLLSMHNLLYVIHCLVKPSVGTLHTEFPQYPLRLTQCNPSSGEVSNLFSIQHGSILTCECTLRKGFCWQSKVGVYYSSIIVWYKGKLNGFEWIHCPLDYRVGSYVCLWVLCMLTSDDSLDFLCTIACRYT